MMREEGYCSETKDVVEFITHTPEKVRREKERRKTYLLPQKGRREKERKERKVLPPYGRRGKREWK